MALTIDDGPDSATTPKLLHALRTHHARAAFFLISEHMTSDSLVWAIISEGHEIGNHLTLDEPRIGLSASAFDRTARGVLRIAAVSAAG
ncbi:MAG: polysaccharide deacetylase family protein [Gemmatimonadaceae bacterium]